MRCLAEKPLRKKEPATDDVKIYIFETFFVLLFIKNKKKAKKAPQIPQKKLPGQIDSPHALKEPPFEKL